jgi:hypothetical protein
MSLTKARATPGGSSVGLRGMVPIDPGDTFEQFAGTKKRPFCWEQVLSREGAEGIPERPLILVIEDEYLLQADVEKILTEAGFATDIFRPGKRH